VGPEYLWGWFLYTNAFADALGLRPFKDVFRTDPDDPSAHADVEGLLSALSTGPVGIGDRVGRTDPAAVRRTCRADGVLVKPNTPVVALDRCFRNWVTRPGAALIGAATTAHAAGTWHYVVTLNATPEPIAPWVQLSELADRIDGMVVVWDWRRQAVDVLDGDGGWDVELEPLDWDYRVVAPVVDGIAVIGDPTLWATAGDMRVAAIERPPVLRTETRREHGNLSAEREVAAPGTARGGGLLATVLGTGESVELVWWSESAGVVRSTVDVPARGWTTVHCI
jgi:hypothetical protein